MLCVAALFVSCPHEDNHNGAPDKDALRALITSADELLERSFDHIAADGDGLAEGDWYVTYDDWQTFSGAVDAARAVLRKAAAAAEIEAAIAALRAARAAFEAAFVTITLQAEPGALVRFNAPNAVYDGGGTVSGFGAGERYLLYPVRVNIMNHAISIQARVKIIASGGDNGIGFISVDGFDRKGYMLTTAGGAKNVNVTNGGSSQAFDSSASVSNAAGQSYVFKTEISGGKIAHYVYNGDTGALITKKDTSTNFSAYYGHAAADTVYAVVGGTNVENMEWSEIVVMRNGIKYRIDALHDQTAIPVFSLGAAAARVRVGAQSSVAYTAQAAGGSGAAVTAVSADPSIVRVDTFAGGFITFTGMKTGRTTISVTHADTSFSPRLISVTVTDFPVNDPYGPLTGVYPQAGAVNVHTDGEWSITFDSPPALDRTLGFIDIHEKTSGALVDTILFAGEKQRTLGATNNIINVGAQMVRVDGNSVYITPHFGKLEYGKEYYVAIPCGAITATLQGVSFNGLTNDKDAASWPFTTRAAPHLASPVSVDGSPHSTADFRTVYGALRAIASQSGNWTVNVAPGVYTELVRYASGAANQTITINGTGGTVIQYTNNDSMNTGTHLRSSFYFSGANLVLQNITLKNTSTRNQASPGQAEALFFANGTGRTLAAYHCTFLSHQDTIQTTGKNWFYQCVIKGDTDYIWGQAEVCLLEECTLVSVNDPYKSEKQAVLLVARTGSTDAAVATVGKGYVLFNCEVTTESGMTTYLARNAGGSGFYDQCAVINTRFINQGTGVIGSGLWRQSNLSFLAGAAEHVGFKVYRNTLDNGALDTAGMPAGSTVMTDALYHAEYDHRGKILNRIYHKSGGYGDSAHRWDIGELELAFGAVR